MSEEKILKGVKHVAEHVVKGNVNSACVWFLYQPKLSSKCIEKFRKN